MERTLYVQKRQVVAMKAIVHETYGGPEVLEFGDVARPEPAASDVLIRVRAASVNPYDWHFLTGTPYLVRLVAGLRRPKQPVLGADVAGVVESVGPDVEGFAPGDRVFGLARGSFAEWAVASPQSITTIPDDVGFDEAAALPMAGLTALQAVRDHADLKPGRSVLVIGAGGGVGMYTTQLAVVRGAHVTGVCSTANVDFVRTLGASDVIDYTSDDFAAGPQRWDVILDNVGDRSFRDLRRSLAPDGVYVMVSAPKHGKWVGPYRRVLARRARFALASQRFANVTAAANAQDLKELAQLVASGQIRSVIAGRYPLADTAAAIGTIASGHGRAKTVIDVMSAD